MTPKIIHGLDKWAILYKKNLWARGKEAEGKLTNSKTKSFLQFFFVFAIVVLIITAVGLIFEYINGDHPIYNSQRIGAICSDGWVSGSTGQGACSHHGGVSKWRYQQIGFHHQNAVPYWITMISTLGVMALFSLFSYSYRKKFSALLLEVSYVVGTIVFVIIFVVVIVSLIPLYIILFVNTRYIDGRNIAISSIPNIAKKEIKFYLLFLAGSAIIPIYMGLRIKNKEDAFKQYTFLNNKISSQIKTREIFFSNLSSYMNLREFNNDQSKLWVRLMEGKDDMRWRVELYSKLLKSTTSEFKIQNEQDLKKFIEDNNPSIYEVIKLNKLKIKYKKIPTIADVQQRQMIVVGILASLLFTYLFRLLYRQLKIIRVNSGREKLKP